MGLLELLYRALREYGSPIWFARTTLSDSLRERWQRSKEERLTAAVRQLTL